MLFMIIETFKNADPIPVYKHLEDKGRGLPDGLIYVDSWIEANFSRCFQIMETDDARTLQEWMLHWRGTDVDFEIIPLTPSKDVRALITPYLEKEG